MPIEFDVLESRKAGTFNPKMKPNSKQKHVDNYEFGWPSPGSTSGPHTENFAKSGTGAGSVEDFLANKDMELIKSYAKTDPYGYVRKTPIKRKAVKSGGGKMRQGGAANAAHGFTNEGK